jgi:short-subunit dehydrogenase
MTNIAAVSPVRPVALITGASAGIGLEFAHRLAERGYDLILVARRRDRLDDLAVRMRAAHGSLRAEVIVADLADAAAPAQIAGDVTRLGLSVDLLVNNAGFGTHGRFETLPAEREHGEIEVNVSALVALTHAFLPAMLQRGSGGIINIASTAAFQPVPYMSVYGATKAFVRSFSEALHEEVRTRGVRVIALCPGPTATEFFDTAVATPRGPIRTVRDVVTTGLQAYDAGSPVVIDGISNKILIAFSNLLPRGWVLGIAARLMHPGKDA